MPPPYAESALEPVMSAKTLRFHHGKHLKTYVETLNKLIANDALNGLRGRQADPAEDRQCRDADPRPQGHAAADHRRMGACLLP
jgi:superoxide dismutase